MTSKIFQSEAKQHIMWKNSCDDKEKRKSGRGGQSSKFRGSKLQTNSWQKTPNSSDAALSDLQESQVFITEYVSSGGGFKGILKSRFSDFHVNEIDVDGNEAVITDLSVPESPKDEMEEKPNAEVESMLTQIITAEQLEQIREVAQGKSKCSDVVEIDVTELTKEERGKIHNGIKSIFGKTIVGSTINKNERKYITVTAYNFTSHVDRRKKWLWPHNYTYFLLYKENVDTIQAASQMADFLKCSTSAFAYAGTKDRRAKTTQWFCLKQFDPNRIASAARKLQNLKIGNFCFKPNTLKLGQLRGNRFRIALRQVFADECVIRESLDGFREKGFINYFGLQRFGNSAEVPTYKVGIEILKGNWKEACDWILKPRNGDPWFMREMRKTWEKTGDAKKALSKLASRNRSIEKQILSWLASHNRDYKGAVLCLARNLRQLYCHSYQSLIWNRVASRRLRELGYRLTPGDLVFVDKVVDESMNQVTLDADTSLQQLELDQKEEADDSESEEHKTKCSVFKSLVKPLTSEDIESSQYTIFDIVLPLPGHDITYPVNDSGKWYEEFLAEDELSSDKLLRKVKKESLPGAYRKVFVKPENLNWNLVSYEKPTDTLILSDLEKLNGVQEPEYKNAPHKALLLDFILPASTYATMALREILKIDTSAMIQRKLEKKQNELVLDGKIEEKESQFKSQNEDERQLDTNEDEIEKNLTQEDNGNDMEPAKKKYKLQDEMTSSQ
ncbi:pseudouridylate synthase 7 homolog isoform X2 [Malaya genurostris]|uniref:pseudouridylate synthase 7 homolog isoform X2 n=1 Tax=Malaya genurostris TaxID=325434 RepID=UPI0026F3F465|nr:pseudouridylate synthase 7 homolog isoform X2 [Malaya genurostris]